MQGWQWLLIGGAWAGALVAFVQAFSGHRKARKTLLELQRTIREARAVMEHRGRIADELAHEVRNPLSAIVSSAQALDLVVGPQLSEPHRQCIKLIHEHGKDLLDLLTSFLELSRIEGGQIKIHPQKIEIAECLGGTVQLLHASAASRNVHLDFKCDESLQAETDPRGLKQIIYNLVINALKFTAPEGRVTVSAGKDAEGTLLLIVEDTGSGMSAEVVKEILTDPCKATITGNGLGLCIVQRLVSALGGSTQVESVLGRGSRFTIAIPGVADVTSARKVLWVGDQTPVPDDIRQLLASSADQVAEAKEALLRIAEASYDAVFVSPSEAQSSLDELRHACEERGMKFVVARHS